MATSVKTVQKGSRLAGQCKSQLNKKSVQNVSPLRLENQSSNLSQLPLIVIVGPTASGKSALALRIAQQYGGEIICADSRTIYAGMDIGTAKPTAAEQALVPHWGLDLVQPGETFTAADFKIYALKKIAEIRKRGHIPLLVGGTGLYIDGVIFDYQFGKSDPVLRKKLEQQSLPALISYCVNNNISLPKDPKNKRYVIRAIEQKSINNKRLDTPIPNTLVVGITTDRVELRSRIEARAEQLFADGMVQEAKKMGKKYGWKNEAMTGNIYKLTKQFLDKKLSADELQQKFITADWQLAKRQITYLKRNKYIVWRDLDGAYELIVAHLIAP